jgi:predicted phage terminase large subunit-like protein
MSTQLLQRVGKLEKEKRLAPPSDEDAIPPDSLEDFVRQTVAFDLHEWQRILCSILERLRYEKGLRILLHAPPQYGKSIIVSQRLPAYLIGHDPTTRIGLACYNETHSGNFGAVVRDLMSSPEYGAMFPRALMDRSVSAQSFSTGPRRALRDGQHSFKAMGLLSGFVGVGVDTIIIDDPYKSAADAFSEAVNAAVWRWWSATAKPRIKPETNVILMYHAYHIDDLAEKLNREGNWERYRFPAIADGRDDAGIDPTCREPGQPLSPMRSLENLEAERASDPQTFAAQFQGTPLADSGGMFNISQIKEQPDRPGSLVKSVRAWDIAATSGGGDYTAGVLMARDRDQKFWILDVTLLQGDPSEVDRAITETAASDGKEVRIHLAEDPGSAGKRDAATLVRKLAGYTVEPERVSGSKESRARSFATQVNIGNCGLVTGGRLVTTGPYRGMTTTEALKKMLSGFPHTTAKKDGVDASADAFNALAVSNRPKFGVV